MNIALPAIPAGILTLLAFFAPYAVALINQPSWTAGTKKLMSIIVSIVLALVVIGFYYWTTGEPIAGWPMLILLTLVVMQASYALVTKGTAAKVEIATSKGEVG